MMRNYKNWLGAVLSLMSARIFAAGSAFLANMLVARQLAPEGYGRFYLLFTIMTLVAGLTGPALDTVLVRFASGKIRSDQDTSLPYFKAALIGKLIILMITLVSGAILARPLADYMLADMYSEYTTVAYLVLLAFTGGAIVSIWGYAQSYFQAHQKFRRYAGFEFMSAMLRLLFVVILLLLNASNITFYLGVYIAAPLITAIVAWSKLPVQLFQEPVRKEVAHELISFGKWVFLASICTTLTQRLDLVLLNLSVMDIEREVIGHYSGAVSLVLAAELLVLTTYHVLLPKASSLQTTAKLRLFLRRMLMPSIMGAFLILAAIPIMPLLTHLALGNAYSATTPFLQVMMAGVAVALLAVPGVVTLYSLGYSRTIAVFETMRFFMTLGLGIAAIPVFGALGMAWVMTVSRAFTAIGTWFAAYYVVSKGNDIAGINERVGP